MLQIQGLRATTAGGHLAVQRAVRAQVGTWLAAAMEGFLAKAQALLSYPEMADLIAERHKIIAGNWQNAATAQLIARCLRRSVPILEQVDFSPAALREDLGGPRTAPAYLYSAAELIGHAADLSAGASVVTRQNERRSRVVQQRVEHIIRSDTTS